MSRRGRGGRLATALVTLAVLAAPAAGPAQEEEEAVRVYRKVSPSVVSLRNAEGSGTGLVLDATGLILTNAHVVASPLPFTAEVEASPGPEAGAPAARLTFPRVEIVGFHPTLDLAAVRIAPAERGVSLTPARLATGPAATGQRVYAIGDPGAGDTVFKRTITAGTITATDHPFEGGRYLQFSAPVNPGNSGGPLADATGAVIGLVTLKLFGTERVGLALPVAGLDLTAFVPFVSRTADPERARALRADADKYARAAERQGPRDEARLALGSRAAALYREALAHDPTNSALYQTLGVLLRGLGVPAAPAAYLARAVQSAPWSDADGRTHRELALALLQDGRREEARVAWQEGLQKYPYTSRLREDLALLSMDEGRYVEAAYEAGAASRVPGGQERYFALRQLREAARARLDAAGTRSLDEREAGLAEALRATQRASDTARAARTLYVTPEFADLVKRLGGAEFPGAAATIRPRGQPCRRRSRHGGGAA